MKSKNALCSAIRQNHAAARGFFTSDFADCADGKPIISYPCHPRNPWFNFFGCDWPRCGLSIAVALQLGMLASSAQAQNLFVESGGNIFEFTPGGAQSTFASGLSPDGLAFNSAGDLFEADTAAATFMNSRRAERKAPLPPGWLILLDWPLTARAICLRRLTTATFMNSRRAERKAPLPPGWMDAVGLAFNSAGNLFVANWPEFPPGNIYEFTPGGAQSTFASGLNNPAGLAFNSAGDLFEADMAAATSMNSRMVWQQRKAPLPPG